MILWLWDAGSAHGVTDDESRARKNVTTLMQSNAANCARVESATLVTGVRTLTMIYRRTGNGWLARRDGSGQIRWEAVSQVPGLEVKAELERLISSSPRDSRQLKVGRFRSRSPASALMKGNIPWPDFHFEQEGDRP